MGKPVAVFFVKYTKKRGLLGISDCFVVSLQDVFQFYQLI
jgi:hypothetical protein